MAVNNAAARWGKLTGGVDNVRKQWLACQWVQYLGQVGLHPFPHACSENDNVHRQNNKKFKILARTVSITAGSMAEICRFLAAINRVRLRFEYSVECAGGLSDVLGLLYPDFRTALHQMRYLHQVDLYQ